MLPGFDLTALPENAKFEERFRGESGKCFVCGLSCGNNPKRVATDGGRVLLDPTGLKPEDAGNTYIDVPIGRECLKKHPELLVYVLPGQHRK